MACSPYKALYWGKGAGGGGFLDGAWLYGSGRGPNGAQPIPERGRGFGAGPEDEAAEEKRSAESAARERGGPRKEREGGSAVQKRKRDGEPGPGAGNGDSTAL